MEFVYPPVIAFARSVFSMQGLKFTIVGDENVPERGGAVMVINHTGYFDFAYAGLAAQKSGRLVRFMAKDTVFTHPVSGPLMRGMRHIPVDRAAGSDSYAAAVAALRSGEIVGVFPEATISRSFELKAFKTGAARMAMEAQVPIIPLAIWGSQRVWTKGHSKRLGRSRVPITMIVGEPIAVPEGSDPAAITAQYKAVMQGLLEVAQSGYEPLVGENLKFLPARLGGTAPTLAEATRLDDLEADERRAAREAKARDTDTGR